MKGWLSNMLENLFTSDSYQFRSAGLTSMIILICTGSKLCVNVFVQQQQQLQVYSRSSSCFSSAACAPGLRWIQFKHSLPIFFLVPTFVFQRPAFLFLFFSSFPAPLNVKLM